MQVKLKVLTGKSAGQTLPVAPEEFLIGRGPECHLRPQSDMISRKHCRLSRKEGELFVFDFGSGNGTLVNGERIEGERKLKSGDKLRVGPLEFEVLVEYELGGAKREKVKDIADAAARTAQRPSADREGDIASWLTDDEGQASTPETRVFSLDEIKVVEHKNEPEEAAKKEAKKKEDAAKDKKQPGKLPAKLPPQPQSAAKDTRDAASEMLKKLGLFKKK